MVLPEWELWACAIAIERRYGADAPRHIAERIGDLALRHDAAGVANWHAIAARLATLMPDRAAPN